MIFNNQFNRFVQAAKPCFSLPLMVLCILLFIAFGPPPTLTMQGTGTANEYGFSVSDLPSGTNRIFLEHGDGSYFLGLSGDFANHKHTYDNGSYTPYADVIPLYDDTSNPKRSAASVNPNAGGTATLPTIDMDGQNIVFKRTGDAVAGDSIVYIVTYTQPNTTCSSSGTIEFSFDNRVFTYVDKHVYNDENPLTTTSSGYTTTLSLAFSNLQSTEQRTVFFLLEALDSAPLNHVLDPQPTINILHNYPAGCGDRTSASYSVAMSGQTVLSSHDPNYKEVLNNGVPDDAGYIYWRVHFQNEGNAPEHTVKVDDWIDPLLLLNTVEVTGSKFPHDPPVIDDVRREIRVVMDNITLRGIGEPGASDESTRGYIDLKAKIDNDQFTRCNAVANSARIYFGCNPPYTTRTVFAPLSCSDIGVPDSCTLLLDTAFAVHLLAAPNTPIFASLGGILDQINSNTWQKKWYPTDGLSDAFVLNPRVTSPVCRTYTLVASNESNCNRVIIRVPVAPSTPMTLNVHLTPLSGCPDAPVWQIDASVPGGSSNLLWNDCSSGPSWSKQGLSGGQTVYVGVWDTQTGCYAEKWVELPTACRRRIPAWIYAVAAAVIILGYLFTRLRNRR